MTTQLAGKNCDGGHYTCSPPKECCKQGCCYIISPIYQPPSLPTGNYLTPILFGHWYVWLAALLTLAAIICACSVRRRHQHACGFGRTPTDRASEPESNGSYYAPPQYSRCDSFHHYQQQQQQPPPPYAEVTAKPDLYPLVIGYDPAGSKQNGHTAGYLMVQYFRNFLHRPVGSSLSATSTVDSLSSSFICNAANEANTIVPPPYSRAATPDESGATAIVAINPPSVSIRDNPCYRTTKQPFGHDSNFVELLNLSTAGGVVASMTASDVSSLANLGTPDSPPRATTPTLEVRELLEKIQQLPALPMAVHRTRSKRFYVPLDTCMGVQNTRTTRKPRMWTSRSAPETPCGAFVPIFTSRKGQGGGGGGSQRGSKTRIGDGSPLLVRREESDEDEDGEEKCNGDECL